MKTNRLLICIFLGLSAFLLIGCATVNKPSHEVTKPKWHSITITPKPTDPQVFWYNRINPIWWCGNDLQPVAPVWYKTNSSFRGVQWFFRNPMANFTSYIIGVADKETIRHSRYPDSGSNPNGGWFFAYTEWGALRLPFWDYKNGKFEFYFGWRKQGQFGIKLNFNQAPKRNQKK